MERHIEYMKRRLKEEGEKMDYSDRTISDINRIEAGAEDVKPVVNQYAVDEKMNKTEILEHMKEKLSDRGKDYGDVTENHARQIDMINPWLTKVLGIPVKLTPSQMAQLMLLVKIGRLIENKNHLDTWADIIGYAACGYEMVSKGDGLPNLNANDDEINERAHWK